MKLRHTLVALALPAALLVGGAQPAAAAGGHTVTVKGSMFINDYETFSDDESGSFKFSKSVALTHAVPTGRVSFSACVGGEVRGTIIVNMSLQADDTVHWAPFLELIEGSTCGSIDQDGYVQGRNRIVFPDHYMDGQWNRTWNKEENTPFDYVRVDYEVHHDL